MKTNGVEKESLHEPGSKISVRRNRRNWIWVWAAITFLCFSARAFADCGDEPDPQNPNGGSFDIEYDLVDAQGNKCNFTEFYQTEYPRVKMYAIQTHHVITKNDINSSGTDGNYVNPPSYADSGPWSIEEITSSDLQVISQFFKTNCSYTNIYSATKSQIDNGADSRAWYETSVGSPCFRRFDYKLSGSTNAEQMYWGSLNGSSQWCWSTDVSSHTIEHVLEDSCSGPTGWLTNDVATHEVKGVTGLEVPSINPAVKTSNGPTHQTYEAYLPPPGFSSVETIDLTDEYTDLELYTNIMKSMGPYSGSYMIPPRGWLYVAASFITPQHTHGELQKMKFRFVVSGSNCLYTISWWLVTVDTSINSLAVSPAQYVDVAGTGDPSNPGRSAPIEVLPPKWAASRFGGLVVSFVMASISAHTSSSAAGSGPFAQSSIDGACPQCGSGNSSLLDMKTSGGISATFGLGRSFGGSSAGSLGIGASAPDAALATPASLWCSANPSNANVIKVSNQIRQVKAAQALVDVITVDPFTYELRYYYPAQFGNVPDSSGLYQPIGSPEPFVKWTIANPNGSADNVNQLRITEIRDSNQKIYDCFYTPESGRWIVDYPGGMREDETYNTTISDETGYTRTLTCITRDPGGPIRSKTTRAFRLDGIPSNTTGDYFGPERLVQETIDPDNSARSTTYYYTNVYLADPTWQPIQKVVHADGTWQYRDYDSSGRLSRVYSGFGDLPAPVSGPPNTNLCRVTVYGYQPLSADDDGSLSPNLPRTIATCVAGRQTSLMYRVIQPGRTDEIRCQRIDANWNDSDNLVTVSKYFTSGSYSNWLNSVQRPDGTISLYAYAQAADGSQTNTVWSGAPNGSGEQVIDGTKEVTVLGPLGEMVSHTVSHVSGAVLASDIYAKYDDLKRPQEVTHIDGRTEYTKYSCCGFDYTVDRDSVTNWYGYDDMKRLTTTTRLGITTTSILDPLGRLLATIRMGSDNSQTTLSQFAYDLAGRRTIETNSLFGVTSHTEGHDPLTGGLIRTTIYPDGGTRIESYYLDGSLKNISGTAAHPVQYLYGVDGDGSYMTEIKVTETGGTNEWTKTSVDLLGRPYKTLFSDNAFRQSHYNNLGQLWKDTDPDGVRTLYFYNAKGEAAYTVGDTNRNDVRDWEGSDSITFNTSDIITNHGTVVSRRQTYIWPIIGLNASNLVSVSETSADGLRSWQTTYRDTNSPVVSSVLTTYGTGGSRSVTAFAPDNSYTISLYSYGRLASVIRFDSLGNQLSSVSYSYDPQGRQSQAVDARNGATVFGYNDADLATSVTTPDPRTPGGAPQTTRTYYNKMLQATNVIYADGGGVTNVYLLTGELGQTSGARTYPVAYTYDYAGRMKTMQIWTNYPNSGAATTTWNYDPYRGFLSSKVYNDNKGPSYEYTAAGRLKKRTWARNVLTTYGYDYAGNLASISYSDSTPGVAYAYDRLGRQSAITAGGTSITSFSYNLAGEPLAEAYSGGTLAGFSVTNAYDPLLRRTNVSVLNGGLRVVNDAFDYDNASRLRNVVDNSTSTPYSAAYINIVNSDLIGQITFKTNGVLRMTTIKQFDFLNRLTSISSIGTAANSTPVSFSYVYNNANQRTLNRSGDGSYWRFGYDSLGQVISGHKYFGDQTPVAGQQFDYAFDTIGNRTQTKTGGDSLGANQRQANYSDNLLNQYISRDVPGAIDVMGIGIATNPVTVNGLTAYRKGEYFRQQVNVANTSTSAWTQVTVSETGQSPQSGYQYLPKTREQFSYDDDGNLTSDGRWNYGWDAENRLTAMTNNTSLGPQQVIRFEYDAKSRRIHKQVWGNNVGSGSATNDVKFVYDGWNLLGVFNSPSTLLQSFLWGLDLSGSIQGAGGVGGLLEVAYYGTQTTNCFVAFDGNGNVSALVNAADGGSVAQYEYGPFGEVLRATGPMAKANPFRFSTKYQDDETDLVYYGGRYLKTTTGGWLSRDPIDEPGFMMLVGNEVIQQPSPAPNGNPYGFVGNDPITYFDVLGFWRSYEHRSLTKIAWDNARLPSELVGITSIYKTIEDANIAVDSGASANDLRRHYNRGLSEDIANAKQRYSEWLRIQQTSFDNLLEHPSRTTCDFALKVLGQLSHSWEDHYAHAIGINSPFRGNPGPIKGDPDHLSPDLKPSSWGGLRNWGEHGFSEPAWREADGGADRAKKAADFVTDKFRAQMPKWWNACHCYYGYN